MALNGLDTASGARGEGTYERTGEYRLAETRRESGQAHRKRSRWSTALVISIVILAASLVALGVIWFSYFQGQQKYARLSDKAEFAGIEESVENASVDWDALYAINPDIVAWVYIPHTRINYPVVRGADNEYYLTHDFDGDQGWLANYGSVFMDYRNSVDWTDNAYFIYGHHMNDGSMFADLAAMAEQSRFDESRTVYVLSPTGDFKLRSYSLVHCEATDPIVQTNFASTEDMAAYVQDKMNRSIVNAGAVPPAGDIGKTFAFATCDNLSAGRYVLFCYIENSTAVNLSGSVGISVDEGGQSGIVNDLIIDE